MGQSEYAYPHAFNGSSSGDDDRSRLTWVTTELHGRFCIEGTLDHQSSDSALVLLVTCEMGSDGDAGHSDVRSTHVFGQDLVVSLLIKVGRLGPGDGDAVHPFDPPHARVPRDDDAQREAMVGRQRFAIHLPASQHASQHETQRLPHSSNEYYLVREENVAVLVHRSLQGYRTAVRRVLLARRNVGRKAGVESLPRCAVVRDARAEEDVPQRRTGPAGVGDGSLGPIDAMHASPRLLGHLGSAVPSALRPSRIVSRKDEVEACTYDEGGDNFVSGQGIPHLFEREVELLDAVYFTIDLDCILLRL